MVERVTDNNKKNVTNQKDLANETVLDHHKIRTPGPSFESTDVAWMFSWDHSRATSMIYSLLLDLS